ncbi:MAG: imidazole glycerol phosphate synthase subunit HisH [Candidatus Omnitrophica bacterium]|nr:imidazole glycerol phosphate synthase subunit HisH [Candidatus Omnitrophota bacterium]MBI3020716.1 imidazole glycerol phosphate synthase subunit HisH [Candidatus Omnitrophota bacterium]MBI3083760.1 imidazole glycerol phosphate synthase subunit HisH [Candidatus Omnitrophota bacterium]
MIVVIDYGMGNLRSVSKALESLGASVRISSEAEDVAAAQKLVLPGVGSFGAAMGELERRGLCGPIKTALASGTPYLGICLGLQLLFESSEESPGTKGLGILPGTVRHFAFPSPLKIPHMGWNQVTSVQRAAYSVQDGCPILKDILEGSFFYFVHSYYAEPADRSLIALEADYGVRFAAMVWCENLFATQFHPEKSQSVGLQLLRNFISL